MSDDPAVRYSVRDLVADLREDIINLRAHMEGRLDRIEAVLARLGDAKADRVDLAALTLRVSTLETAERERVARAHWRRWLIPVLVSVGLLLISLVQVVVR